MAFYARRFIFNDIPSEFYGLYLGELSGSGETATSGSNDISPLTQKLFRKPTVLFYGAEQTPVLSFPLSIYSENEITAEDYSKISGWLFGQQNYGVLRICQNDMQSTYFNCFLTTPEITRIGNMIQSFTTTVICDSPWGWGENKTYYKNYIINATTYEANETITFFNESANSFYTYPTNMIISANVFGGSLTITNHTDAHRAFILTLSPFEVITMNCDLQFITSTISSYPLSQFNLKWLRLVRGYNELSIVGNIQNITITYPVAVKVA
jgi:phage-related protein